MKTKYNRELIAEQCREAYNDGVSMSAHIAHLYNLPKSQASTLISQIRAAGFDIPRISVQTDDWERDRRNIVRLRRELLT